MRRRDRLSAYVAGVAGYLPAHVVDNAELAASLGCDAAWIESTTGIRERRYAGDGENVVTMGIEAARRCLLAAGGESHVGLVLVASGSGDRRFPGPATRIAAGLGLADVAAIDVPHASTGAIAALAMAASLCHQFGDVLVVATEHMSALTERENTATEVRVIFGDGAGAALVSAAGGALRVDAAELHANGSFADALTAGLETPLVMDGRTVILQAARRLPQVIASVLDRCELTAAAVESFVLHQANANLTRQVARALDVPLERFFSNIGVAGNTSSASVLIALSELFAGRPVPPSPLVAAAFGAGLHWGAVLLTASDQPLQRQMES